MLMRRSGLFLVMGQLTFAWLLAFGFGVSFAQPTATFQRSRTADALDGKDVAAPDKLQRMRVGLPFTISNLPEDPAERKQRIDALRKHLADRASYRFSPAWPGNENVVDTASEHEGDRVAFQLVEDPRPEPLNKENTRWTVVLTGLAPGLGYGTITVSALPADWKMVVVDSKGSEAEGNAILYSSGEDWVLPKSRAKVQLAQGSGGPNLEFSGALRLSEASNPRVVSASVAGKVPLRQPSDVKDNPDASNGASKKEADMLSADLNFISYSKGGDLTRAGARTRVTAGGDGFELVGYYSPFTGWFGASRGFYGLEGEAGYRKGDAEFKDLVTKAPDRGNAVLRIGGVAEWAPLLGPINRDLSQGLRFFLRGRGWFDTYKNDYGKETVRFAPFLDSELFYNFTKAARVFLRAEYGSLPPDLTKRVSRASVGVGAAF